MPRNFSIIINPPPGALSKIMWQRSALALVAAGLVGCSSVKYTVDDGRPVNETLLGNIRLLGQGERTLRPAIVRTGQLNDPDCSTQWELPFGVATSYEWDETDRVAWVRALQVDERLSVISAARGCGLDYGDKLVEVDGYSKKDSNKMLVRLASLRDSGEPFPVKTASGREVTVTPFKVCRGYARLAPPSQPAFQDFHWLMSTHPLELFNPLVTPDEALWMVLWTQGLSEEGGAKMKTFHYGKEFLLTMLDVASLAMGVNAAAQAAKVAYSQAATAASSAATKAATEAVARQILEEAGKEAAQAAAKEYAQKIGEEVAKSVGKQASVALRDTFLARMGFSVSSLSWVASTAFDDADAWTFDRMRKLGADPVAGASLHRKLMDRGLTRNTFVLDEERLGNLALHAKKTQSEEILLAALRGASLDAYSLKLTDLPQSSNDADSSGPAAGLDMPLTSPIASNTSSSMPQSMPTESSPE